MLRRNGAGQGLLWLLRSMYECSMDWVQFISQCLFAPADYYLSKSFFFVLVVFLFFLFLVPRATLS